ncbi:hypothetical protein BH11PSE12_BH11PSE12_12740 [soil metagenome]
MLQYFAAEGLLGNYQHEYSQQRKKSLLEALLCCIIVGKILLCASIHLSLFFCSGILAPVARNGKMPVGFKGAASPAGDFFV